LYIKNAGERKEKAKEGLGRGGGLTPFFLRPTTEREVLMKRIMMLMTVALVVAAMMLAMAMPAFAAPRPPGQGTCDIGGLMGEGASGCAGNIGGFIVTEQQGCKDINRGPFTTGEFSCQ
jgi:hypothetical protein